MATDYGTDILALEDLSDPEQLVSGDAAVAQALAHRLMTAPGAYNDDTGDPEAYDSIDLGAYLAADLDASALRDLEAQAVQVLSQDPRVSTVAVTASFNAGVLSVSVVGEGADGPFSFVLTIDQVSGASLQVI